MLCYRTIFCYNSSPNYVSTLDPWMYTCQKNYLGQDEACVRMKTPGKVNGGISFAECKLTCGLDLQVWPKIHGDSNKMKVSCFAIFCLVLSESTNTYFILYYHPLKKYLTSAGDVHFTFVYIEETIPFR